MNDTHTPDSHGEHATGTLLHRHTGQAGLTSTRRASSSGFSTVELAVSLGIFLILSVVITLAVARTMGATAESRSIRAAEAIASDLLNTVGTQDYASVVDGSFHVPDPCPSQTSTGIDATSCVTSNGVDVVVSYQYQAMSAADGMSCSATASNATATAATYGFVGLCATIDTIGGAPAPDSIHTVTSTVNSPSPKYAPDGGVVRITVSGSISLLPTATVYLVRAHDPSLMVGSAVVNSAGLAYIATTADPANGTTPPGSCTTTDPCMVALLPGSTPAQIGTAALYGPDARPDAAIVTPLGKVVDASVQLTQAPTLRIDLSAAAGTTRTPLTASPEDNIGNPAGSVCLWARISDGVDTDAPLCNDVNSSTITATNYTPAGQETAWPLPAGATISLTTDPQSGLCSYTQRGYNPATGTFTPAKVCTSWTWGSPSNLPAAVTLGTDGSTTYFDTVWTPGAAGNPAAGWIERPSSAWTHPRSIPGCAASGQCTAVTQPPEHTWCPNDYCRSGAVSDAPYLTSPIGAVIVAPATTATFNVRAEGQSTVSMYQLDTDAGTSGASVPAGTLSAGGTPAAPGSLLSTGTGAAALTYTYTRPAGYDSSFTIKLRLCPNTDGPSCAGGATRSITILPGNPIGILRVDDKTVPQNSGTVLRARLTDFNGAPIPDAAVTFNLAGVATTGGSTTVSTGADGVASLPVHVNADATVGTAVITATVPGATGVSASGTLTITAVPATVNITETTTVPLIQNGKKTFTVHVSTAAGGPVPKAPVSALVTGPDPSTSASATVYAEAGCITDTSGQCVITIDALAGAPAGRYTLTSSASGVQGSAEVTVVGIAAAIALSPNSPIVPGTINKAYTLTVIDRAGSVLPAAVLDLTGDADVGPNPPTNTAVPVTTTGAGTAPITLTALLSAADGNHTLHAHQQLTGISGLPPLSTPVTVTNTTTHIAVNGSVTVSQNGSTLVQVIVKDSANRPITGRVVNLASHTPGLTIDTTATTDNSGVATATLHAGAAQAGPGTISAWTDDNTPTSIDVTIQATPASVNVTGALTQAGTSSVVFTLLDVAGDPIPNAPISVLGLPAGVTVTESPSGTTSLSGQFIRTLTDNGPLASGVWQITVTSGATFSTTAALTIQGRPGTLSTPSSPLNAPKALNATAVYTLYDAAGDTIPAYPITITWQVRPDGCTTEPLLDNDVNDASTSSFTRRDGTIDVDIFPADTCTAGTYPATLTAGNLTTTLPIIITNAAPGVVRNVTATANGHSVDITWAAPFTNGGSIITGYTATLTNTSDDSTAATCSTTTATACSVGGLVSGTYRVTVTATNSSGVSAPSAPSEDITVS